MRRVGLIPKEEEAVVPVVPVVPVKVVKVVKAVKIDSEEVNDVT